MGEKDRILVPEEMAWHLINKIHRFLMYFGTDKITEYANRYFHIENIDKIAKDVAASCQECIQSKIYTRPTTGEQYFDQPQQPEREVAVDLMGPLPESSNGNKYILVICDVFSKLTALYQLPNAKAETIINKIEKEYIERRGAAPPAIITDNGLQFNNKEWQELIERLGATHKRTSPYNPQSNPVERVMRELGRIFRTYSSEDHTGWDRLVARTETVINETYHASTGFAPKELEITTNWFEIHRTGVNQEIKGTLKAYKLPKALLPTKELNQSDAESIITKAANRHANRVAARNKLEEMARRRRREQVKKHGVAEDYKIGDLVWRKTKRKSSAKQKNKKLFPIYEGPLRIISKPAPNAYELQWEK